MRPNKLRQLLNEGKPTIGTHLICSWPGLVEIVGQTGAFDYIEFVGEYAAWDIQLLEDWGRAIDLFPNMSSMFKVEEQTRGFIAQRAIDAGIQNVLFTDIRSAAEARECVRLVRAETPTDKGVHGAGMRRAVGWVYGGNAEWCQAMHDVVIAVMVEKKGAMDDLEAILAVPGVDMLQFGPTDYSISVGVPGQGRTDPIQAQQRKMCEMALKAGKHPRVEIGSFEQAKPWLDIGVRHFCIGWDIVTLSNWCKAQGEGIRSLLK
jgi:2-keto-3-deoxy-L-rhamnonate aldolase RhmA